MQVTQHDVVHNHHIPLKANAAMTCLAVWQPAAFTGVHQPGCYCFTVIYLVFSHCYTGCCCFEQCPLTAAKNRMQILQEIIRSTTPRPSTIKACHQRGSTSCGGAAAGANSPLLCAICAGSSPSCRCMRLHWLATELSSCQRDTCAANTQHIVVRQLQHATLVVQDSMTWHSASYAM